MLAALLAVQAGRQDRVDASEAQPELDRPEQVDLHVSADGTALHLAGPIVFGVKQRVLAILEEHPGVTTLHLTSPGGRVVEARDLSEMIAERGFTTVADGNCASACTVIFLAGRERVLAPTATLGFHRYRSPDKDQLEAEENMAIDRRYFSARGLPDWFIERAFATPNSGMWRPTVDEMKVARVITAEMDLEGHRIPVAGEPSRELAVLGGRRRDGGLSVNATESPH